MKDGQANDFIFLIRMMTSSSVNSLSVAVLALKLM